MMSDTELMRSNEGAAMRTVPSWLALLLAVAVMLMSTAAWAQEKTSENNEQVANFLKRFPASDADKDGVLTMKEVQTYRRETGMNNPQQGAPGGQQAGQQRNQRQAGGGQRLQPTFANVAYGPHERNVIDFWKAESDKPAPVLVFFHGGGFKGGDKQGINAVILKECLDAGISCAASNYRLSGHAPYPAQMHDSARAIQFIRSKSKEWNIDKSRLAAYGGSAGSGISLWLAFHDDMADPKSKDPVARESTRLTCAIGLQMQCSYDPRAIKEIVPGPAYDHVALKLLHGLTEEWDWDTATIDAKLDAALKDCSPITHLTKDDPPVFLYHRKEQETDGNIHHPNFGRHLKAAMDKIGIDCIHRMDTDYKQASDSFLDVAAFVKKQFGK